MENINKPYKCIIFISMLYFVCFIGSAILANRLILIDGITGSAATLIFPITYLCSDTIAEVYGYKVAKQIIWSGLLCEIIFSLIMFFLIQLPAPKNWVLKNDYYIVLDPLLRICIASFVAMGLGAFINIYLLTKWKISFKGKMFWLRSFIASTIGELIFTVIADFIIFYGKISHGNLLSIIITSYLFKLIFAPLAVMAASILVIILKNIEQIDVYDYNTNFNPFKA